MELKNVLMKFKLLLRMYKQKKDPILRSLLIFFITEIYILRTKSGCTREYMMSDMPLEISSTANSTPSI